MAASEEQHLMSMGNWVAQKFFIKIKLIRLDNLVTGLVWFQVFSTRLRIQL